MDLASLDTDMLNEVLKKKNLNVVRRAAEYLAEHSQFAMSSITRFEALRGLKENCLLTNMCVLTDVKLFDELRGEQPDV